MNVFIQSSDLVIRCSSCDPVENIVCLVRADIQLASDHRIHRPFSDRAAAQLPVLRVTECSFLIAKRFAAGCELLKMRLGIDQKISMLLVMDHRARFRIKKSGVAEFVFVNAKILVQENTYVNILYAVRSDSNTSE